MTRRMTPAIPLTDRRFVYVPSHATDIRVRFAQERARIARQQSHHRIFEERRSCQQR